MIVNIEADKRDLNHPFYVEWNDTPDPKSDVPAAEDVLNHMLIVLTGMMDNPSTSNGVNITTDIGQMLKNIEQKFDETKFVTELKLKAVRAKRIKLTIYVIVAMVYITAGYLFSQAALIWNELAGEYTFLGAWAIIGMIIVIIIAGIETDD